MGNEIQVCCNRFNETHEFDYTEMSDKKLEQLADEEDARVESLQKEQDDFKVSDAVVKQKRVGWNADKITVFESELPFDNIQIGGFYDSVIQSEENSQGYVLYETFKADIC